MSKIFLIDKIKEYDPLLENEWGYRMMYSMEERCLGMYHSNTAAMAKEIIRLATQVKKLEEN